MLEENEQEIPYYNVTIDHDSQFVTDWHVGNGETFDMESGSNHQEFFVLALITKETTHHFILAPDDPLVRLLTATIE